MTISRRHFIGVGAAAAAGLTLDREARAESLDANRDASLSGAFASPPVVIASANGIRGVARAYEMITRQNADTLDAIIAGVNIQELDPEDQSVGLGGLPNEDGVVQLDASCMGVPGHDQRDFDFASKFDLPIVRVVCGEREDANTPLHEAFTECEAGTLVNSGVFDGYEVEPAKKAIVEMLAKGGSAKPIVHYRLHDWCISRQRYWGPPIPIIYCDDCGTVPVPDKDLPVVLPFIEDFKPDDSGVSPLARHEDWYRVP